MHACPLRPAFTDLLQLCCTGTVTAASIAVAGIRHTCTDPAYITTQQSNFLLLPQEKVNRATRQFSPALFACLRCRFADTVDRPSPCCHNQVRQLIQLIKAVNQYRTFPTSYDYHVPIDLTQSLPCHRNASILRELK